MAEVLNCFLKIENNLITGILICMFVKNFAQGPIRHRLCDLKKKKKSAPEICRFGLATGLPVPAWVTRTRVKAKGEDRLTV